MKSGVQRERHEICCPLSPLMTNIEAKASEKARTKRRPYLDVRFRTVQVAQSKAGGHTYCEERRHSPVSEKLRVENAR